MFASWDAVLRRSSPAEPVSRVHRRKNEFLCTLCFFPKLITTELHLYPNSPAYATPSPKHVPFPARRYSALCNVCTMFAPFRLHLCTCCSISRTYTVHTVSRLRVQNLILGAHGQAPAATGHGTPAAAGGTSTCLVIRHLFSSLLALGSFLIGRPGLQLAASSGALVGPLRVRPRLMFAPDVVSLRLIGLLVSEAGTGTRFKKRIAQCQHCSRWPRCASA